MLALRTLSGIAKALLTTTAPLPGSAEHRRALAGSTTHAEPQKRAASEPFATDPMSAAASRGLEIRRSLPTKAAAKWFVDQMQSYELTGERTWRALWELYLWLCQEEQMTPLPETMQARFANELGKLCQRGQVRIREGGRLRRLTTYVVPDAEPAYLRAAA